MILIQFQASGKTDNHKTLDRREEEYRLNPLLLKYQRITQGIFKDTLPEALWQPSGS
jgi:hypothetical protein